MQPNTPVEWKELVETYNYMYSAEFRSARAMIKYLYKEHETLEGVSEIIGVSGWTIGKYMDKWGLKKLPKGHRGNSEFQVAFRKIKNPKQYTYGELAEMIDCSAGYVAHLLKYYTAKKEEIKCHKK